MSLVRYSDIYWFPNGALAANIPARIFPVNSNALAPIFSDIVGTPMANPTATDGAGVLTFWAQEGKYWVHIDTEAFLVDAGLSEEEADLTTGVASGGEMNINAGNPQAVDIAALVGYVVDNNDLLSAAPSIIKVDEPAQTVVMDGPAQARAITNWLMDSAGNVIQQANPPTPTQRRTHLQIGASLYDTLTASLIEVQTQQVVLGQPVNQLADLMDALGVFNIQPGNTVSAVAGTLQINISAGSLFSRSLNHFQAGVLTQDPHINPTGALTPATFKRVIRTPESPLPPDVLTVDPANYDLNGVLTPVGGGVNTSTVQRVYRVPSTSPSAQVAVQYGQQTHATLSAAVSAIGFTNFIPNPVSGFGALVGYIAMTRVATDLSNPTHAVFVQPSSKLPSH